MASAALMAVYLGANTNTYGAWDQRRSADQRPHGPGIADLGSFKVLQRQAGASMVVDIGATGVGLQAAWVRGSTRGGQGLYRVDTVDRAQPTADTYVAQLFDTVATADGANPRIDQVILEVLDQIHVGSSNLAQIRIVAGTPTGGATLDNRTGVAALPASSLLLADVVVGAGAGSIVTANIRDRRAWPLLGGSPSTFSALDAVQFMPAPGQYVSAQNVQNTATCDAQQACALMYLPRRIVGATRLRWRYQQGGTANAQNYNIGIYDASGRQIVTTGAQAYAGLLNTVQNASVTISATTFEPGYYWVWIGNAAGTASASVIAASVVVAQTNLAGGLVPNLTGFAAAGGTTAPATILGLTDQNTINNVTVTQRLAVPIVALSVG